MRALLDREVVPIDAFRDVDTVTNPPSNNDVLTYSIADGAWVPAVAPGATGGEANTGSNQGTDGEGVYDTKVGVDLQFRNIAPASSKITVVLNGKDIDLDVAQANLSLTLSQISDITATATEVNYLDLGGLTAGWVLSADTATTASWKAPSSGVTIDGTPLNDQVALWTSATNIEGTTAITVNSINDVAFTGDDFVVGSTGQYQIRHASTAGIVTISGGAPANPGGEISFYGGTNGTRPGDVQFNSGGNPWLIWDEDVGDVEFSTGIGAKTTALTIGATQNASFAGIVGATGMHLSADNPSFTMYDEAVGRTADNLQWQWLNTNEELVLRPLSDIGGANDPSMVLTRTLNVTDQITFSAVNLLFQGSGGGATTTNFTGNLDVSGAVFHGAGNQNLDSTGGVSAFSGALSVAGALTATGGIDKLTTATGVVSVAAATAPTTGQVLTATSGTVATWQTPSVITSIDDLSDVDTTTNAPVLGDTLAFDGTNWVTNLTQLIREVDDVAGITIYIGEAQPGTTTATAAWRVKRTVFTGDDSETLFADGDVNFDNTWTGRAGFSYS